MFILSIKRLEKDFFFSTDRPQEAERGQAAAEGHVWWSGLVVLEEFENKKIGRSNRGSTGELL